MSFWAIEVVPGKVYSSKPVFPLKVTKAVLPPQATDAGRSVVQVKIGDKLFSVASLKLDHQESVPLDLIFEDTTEEIHFVVTGKNPVHLVGYYVPSDEEPGDYSDEDGEGFAFDEDDADLVASDGSEEEEEVPAKPQGKQQQQGGQKRKPEETNGNATKKPKQQDAHEQPKQQQGKQQQQGTPKQQQQPNQGQKQGQTPKQGQAQGQQTPKGGKPQQGQTPKAEEKGEASPSQDKPVIGFTKNLGDKLKAVILKVGSGNQRASKGEMVTVKYVGKLDSGRVFDKSESFQFRLGVGQVISGWDRGVSGMAVGEKRTLIVPPSLAYGSEGVKGTIPQNATLTFDVELVRIGRK